MILINATNLHAGGGVQVAASFIGELTLMSDLPRDLHIWVSSEVDLNLRTAGFDISSLPEYKIIDTFGFRQFGRDLRKKIKNFSLIFTIFGPLYIWKLKAVNVTGFAQAWILYPNNECAKSLKFRKRLLMLVKYKIQTIFYKRADLIFVELEHVRDRLVERRIIDSSKIKVVYNCISSLYYDPRLWSAVFIPPSQSDISLGFIGRNYTHKNTSIFLDIKKLLKEKYKINAVFYVTFTEDEWLACSDDFRSNIVNVGPLMVSQCPLFYSKVDAVIFPSLLECFSATPLEAMAMSKPLFASDRPFNRDICGDYAFYFDPMAPESAASAIANYMIMKDCNHMITRLHNARNHALAFSSSSTRARNYLNSILLARTESKKF